MHGGKRLLNLISPERAHLAARNEQWEMQLRRDAERAHRAERVAQRRAGGA